MKKEFIYKEIPVFFQLVREFNFRTAVVYGILRLNRGGKKVSFYDFQPLNRRTVEKALLNLQEKGYISFKKHYGFISFRFGKKKLRTFFENKELTYTKITTLDLKEYIYNAWFLFQKTGKKLNSLKAKKEFSNHIGVSLDSFYELERELKVKDKVEQVKTDGKKYTLLIYSNYLEVKGFNQKEIKRKNFDKIQNLKILDLNKYLDNKRFRYLMKILGKYLFEQEIVKDFVFSQNSKSDENQWFTEIKEFSFKLKETDFQRLSSQLKMLKPFLNIIKIKSYYDLIVKIKLKLGKGNSVPFFGKKFFEIRDITEREKTADRLSRILARRIVALAVYQARGVKGREVVMNFSLQEVDFGLLLSLNTFQYAALSDLYERRKDKYKIVGLSPQFATNKYQYKEIKGLRSEIELLERFPNAYLIKEREEEVFWTVKKVKEAPLW